MIWIWRFIIQSCWLSYYLICYIRRSIIWSIWVRVRGLVLCSIFYLLWTILTILSNLYFRLFPRRISLRRTEIPFDFKLIRLLLFNSRKLSLTWNFWKLLLRFIVIWGSNVLILIILIYPMRCWRLMLVLMRYAADWIIVLMFN